MSNANASCREFCVLHSGPTVASHDLLKGDEAWMQAALLRNVTVNADGTRICPHNESTETVSAAGVCMCISLYMGELGMELAWQGVDVCSARRVLMSFWLAKPTRVANGRKEKPAGALNHC